MNSHQAVIANADRPAFTPRLDGEPAPPPARERQPLRDVSIFNRPAFAEVNDTELHLYLYRHLLLPLPRVADLVRQLDIPLDVLAALDERDNVV